MRDLVRTVVLLGIVQGIGLAGVLWGRRANTLANRLLAMLVGGVALMLALGEVGRQWGRAGHPHLLGLGIPLPFLFGPLLYLYVVSLTRPLVRFDPRWLAHAIPFVADALYLFQVFYLKSGDEKLALAHQASTGHTPLSFDVVGLLEVAQALVYLVLSWRALGRYGRKMHGYYSDLARIDLRWLRALVVAQVAIWCVVLVAALLRLSAHAVPALEVLVQVGSALAIFLIGYVSLWQPELVEKARAARVTDEEPPSSGPKEEPPRVEPPAPPPEARPKPKYQRNRLDASEATEIVHRLETLMVEKELFKDSGLTLPTLAGELGITTHTLSQVLNVHVGKSFFVFVNAHRVEALKRALVRASNADRGVLELGLEVGFSSKSTLNSFFKKQTGMTPTEYRARVGAGKIDEKSRV